MRKLMGAALVVLLCSQAWSEENKILQVHFVCDTKDAAKQMVKNIFIGHRMRAVGCQDIEDLQHSIVELVGDLEPVQWQNKVAYIGYVQNDFIRGYSAGQLEYLVN
ncbi:MAG: hypothetical protein OXI66_10795 [Boseongicola sp.]|nr:hypothetical protein [Boseongicola sp.]